MSSYEIVGVAAFPHSGICCKSAVALDHNIARRNINATAAERMMLLPARRLPSGSNWAYELKLDGDSDYMVLASQRIP